MPGYLQLLRACERSFRLSPPFAEPVVWSYIRGEFRVARPTETPCGQPARVDHFS